MGLGLGALIKDQKNRMCLPIDIRGSTEVLIWISRTKTTSQSATTKFERRVIPNIFNLNDVKKNRNIDHLCEVPMGNNSSSLIHSAKTISTIVPLGNKFNYNFSEYCRILELIALFALNIVQQLYNVCSKVGILK